MCGIAGFVVIDSAVAEDVDAARALGEMAAVMVHRGPDDDGFFHADGVGFAFRRLAIIDRAGARQPIPNEDGSVVAVFNGEIYNHRRLRALLEERGHRFATRGDGEVLVHGYEEWGEDGLVERLNGMFAFALLDRRRRRVVLARDRLGIKPLHLTEHKGRLLFASEPKSILTWPGYDAATDPQGLLDYLVLGYVPAPRTLHRGLERLRPGHLAVVEGGRVRRRRYWTPPFACERVDPERAAREVRERLFEAVRDRLEAEVPLGCFLSGGIDSSAVAAAMVEARGRAVDAVTVGFEDVECDERREAERVARHLRIHPHVEIVRPDPSVIDAVLRSHDEAHADPSDVPTHLLCAAARRHVTVALSGDGGDELFAGYRRYAHDRAENRVRALLPASARRWLRPLGEALPKGDALPRPLRAKSFVQNVARDPVAAYLRSVSRMLPEDALALLRPEVRAGIDEEGPLARFREAAALADGKDPVLRARAIDLETWLPDDILAKVDRASMAHSLEVRVPFLDHRLVEYAVSLHPSLLLRGASGKRVLKRALRGILPGEILHRRKHGFDLPVREWLSGPLAAEGTALGEKDGPLSEWLDPCAVRRLVDEDRSGRLNREREVWALILLARSLGGGGPGCAS